MKRLDWNGLTLAERDQALARPDRQQQAGRIDAVQRLIEQVRADGDATLRALTRRFDGVELGALEVSTAEFEAAAAALPEPLKAAIDAAYTRIRAFHQAGMAQPFQVETASGVLCERIIRPIATVGLYVPAGSAPLPSTALMLGVPAELAGCAEVILCSPPQSDGRVDASVLVAARRCGIHRVFKLGGAQAIAAMAYGTETVPRCAKLFGPGNAWVTTAKRLVAADPDGAAIDLPAGPSELLVIADADADPAYVAADLLSQAEHGPDSQVLLVSDSVALIDAVQSELARQLIALPRAAIAERALAGSRAILVDSIEQALAISNRYAPEHLILAVDQARRWLPAVAAAGSVFLGRFAPEAIGDYCSGTNHVLPTEGAARAFSGLSVASFQTQISVQELSASGLRAIAPCALTLAAAEGLDAHANAIRLRLEDRS
ncbi:MAG: histidinol dehydrogenase [Lysobacterales bacterium]